MTPKKEKRVDSIRIGLIERVTHLVIVFTISFQVSVTVENTGYIFETCLWSALLRKKGEKE